MMIVKYQLVNEFHMLAPIVCQKLLKMSMPLSQHDWMFRIAVIGFILGFWFTEQG